MPYISASIIVQMMAVVVPQLQALRKEGEAGRRKLTQYTRWGTVGLAAFQGAGAAIAFQNQGVVIAPGPQFVFLATHDARGRHHVPDVARRADHRARSRQRHLDDHPRGHRRGAAGRHRRHAGTGSQRRDQPGAGADPGRDDRGGDGVRRVRRARAASHPGQLREAPAGSPRVCRHHDAPAVQAQHVGRDSADLRLEPAAVPGDDRELVRHERELRLAAERWRRASASVSPCTWSCTPR